MLDILYFAWVRERIGIEGEQIAHPGAGATIEDVIAALMSRGQGYVTAFEDRSKLRAALDQRFVGLDETLGQARELALFPPVTGG